ncbi:M48 family metallopeptidase [Hymenobacter elongatus]|uniref:Peptidase n=1 Tax=Hymenobacter elongatus TaxID=877208 RepID=A0A4Z0PLS8_9BACT|nr:M48 family metallopeptidase [Hymenobacter elongatus]TGE16413.1 peptidase [Hymenobacter elongatus]
MKKQFLTLAVCLVAASFSGAQAQLKLNTKSIGAGLKAAKAITLSDEEVIQHTQEYVAWMDANNSVAPATHPLAKRLQKLVATLGTYDGMSMNYKVYLVKDVNAFACADGSVRVFAGLLDLMTDQEVLGVIGHEIGHVKHKDSRDAFRTALLSSALKEGVSSQGGAGAALSDSQLGDLGQAVANASFSRAQESSADGYGYELLKGQKVNPWYMASAFGKLQKLSEDAGQAKASKGAQLFSSHPDTEKRMAIVTERATKDGFAKPAK